MILVFLEQSFHVSWVSAVVEISAGYIADGRIYASCLRIPKQSHGIIFSELYWTRDFIAEELLNKVLHIEGFMNKELHVLRSLKKGLPKNALNYKGILHKWLHVQGYLGMDYIFLNKGFYVQGLLNKGLHGQELLNKPLHVDCSWIICFSITTGDYMFKNSWTRAFKKRSKNL